jgi:pimeloyl-ACP methyl ester carboxylesterase
MPWTMDVDDLISAISDTCILLRDGRRLAYAEYSDPAGAPVLLFHGLPGSRLSWGLLPGNPFPPGLRLIAPDRPGYGRSDPDPGRTLLDWADDVAQLADTLELERFAIVGVSGGGPGALACAWKLADRLASVAVVSSPAPTNAPGVLDGMSKANRFFMKLAWHVPWLSALNVRFLASMIRRNPARYIESMSFKLHAVDRLLLERSDVKHMLSNDFAESVRNSGQGMVDDMAANHGRPWGFLLQDIHTHVRFWFCELDRSIPPAMGRYLSESVPSCDARFVPDAGHLWVLVHMHEVLDELEG